MTMASRHRDKLKEYCRLCGNKSTLLLDRKPYQKEQFEKVINEALCLQMCLKDEDADVFPPFICKTCERKLSRFRLLKRQKRVFTVNIPLHEFKQHCNECQLCQDGSDVCSIEDVLQVCREVGESNGMSTSKQPDRTLFFTVCLKGDMVTVPKSLSIFSDRKWSVSVIGKELKSKSMLSGIPEVLDTEAAKTLMERVGEAVICHGNSDFVDLLEDRTPKGFTIDNFLAVRTVRSVSCKLVSEMGEKCSVCTIQRSDLLSIKNRQKLSSPMKSTVSSRAKLTSLTKRQLVKRARNLQEDRRKLCAQKKTLQKRIKAMFEAESVVLSEEQGRGIGTVVEESKDAIESMLEKNTPQSLLWKEQNKALAVKNRKQIRWHPAIIRWAIAVNSKSPAAYKLIKESGFLILPSTGTLNKYTKYTDARTGIHTDIIQQMVEDMNITESRHADVTLLCDEMKLKSGLAYSMSTGRLLGFVDIGSVNNELRAFERQAKKDTDEELATHAFMVMVRGVFSSVKQAVALFPSSALRSGDIYQCVIETILHLETAGVRVRAVVSDGASCNRRFYKLCSDASRPFHNSMVHPLDANRKIYFFCDVPHLLKTTRNNLENSGFARKSRNLQFRQKQIRWTHLIQLYQWDSSTDLRMLPRLSSEHLYLTPSLRMRVKLATQVLSQSVANALRLRTEKTGDKSMDGTREFVEIFNKFFDCLNVASVFEGRRKRNSNMHPYRSVDDDRFKWLTEVFLKYISDWEEEIANTPNLTALERERRCISRETREGLRITVHSFVSLTKELLREEGVEYVLSEKFSQDPIEEYFSKQRRAGGANDNPSVQQIANNMLTFQVAGAAVKASRSGNVTQRDGVYDLGDQPLPKRKKKCSTD